MRAAAWATPAIALAAAVPRAAASGEEEPSVTIDSITYSGFASWYHLVVSFEHIPVGPNNYTNGILTWTPSVGSTVGVPYFGATSSGSKTIVLAEFTSGTTYTFTATITIPGGNPISASYPYTF